jgi:hypothetical protein
MKLALERLTSRLAIASFLPIFLGVAFSGETRFAADSDGGHEARRSRSSLTNIAPAPASVAKVKAVGSGTISKTALSMKKL